jgi:hypothetical protein
MSESGTVEDPLAGWDPRRRAALERLWREFEASGEVRLSDEVIADRRQVAVADHADARDELTVERRTASPYDVGEANGE